MLYLILITLFWALVYPQPLRLRLYFLAQLVYIPATRLAYWRWGYGSRYGAVYYSFTALILLAILGIVLEALKHRHYRLRPMVIAALLPMALGKMAWMGVGAPTWYDRLTLAEGCFLIWAGFILGLAAKYCHLQGVAVTLGLLWIVQGAFDLGWVLHPGWASWRAANWPFNETACSVAFLIVGNLLFHRWLNPRIAAPSEPAS